MLWPSPADYAQAVKDFPHVCLLDPRLKGGKPHRGTNNVLLVYSGGFSTVFRIEVTPTIYALRCWIKDVGDAQRRYEAISDCLKQVGLPYFVDFEYVSDGILINGKRYPITRMEWAAGETLRDFIEQNLQDANILKTAAQEFRQMFETLHAHHIAHGDLQDGNILLKRNGNQVEIKLIDYDSLYVPALRGQSSPTPGLPEYQHPTRGAQLDENVDYFSELVIYLSFLSLSENPSLWAQFKGRSERGLLFSKADFENPTHSDVFHELEKLSTDVQQLASTLKNFCAKTSIDQLSPLEDILPKSPTIPPDEQYYNLGMTYRKSQQYPQAIAEFQKAIGLNPDFKEAYHALGLTYLQIGKLDEARKAADAALVIDPTYSPARQLLEAMPQSTVRPVPPPDGTVNLQSQIQKLQDENADLRKQLDEERHRQPKPGSTPPNPSLHVWQWIASGFLSVALVVCFMVLIGVRNDADYQLTEVRRLEHQVQGLQTEVQRLQNEKADLQRELDATLRQLNNARRNPNSSLPILPIMVRIPAGEFRMGSNSSSYSVESPLHSVVIDAFSIDKYEVTNAQYKMFVDANPEWRKDRIPQKYHDGGYLKHWIGNTYPSGKGNHPVIYVSWYAAMAYARWTGRRLPTEAEWEKAAGRQQVNLQYPWGNSINSSRANYGKPWGITPQTTAAGQYLANRYGLYDMIGNVSEWCIDAYDPVFYGRSPRRNPVAGSPISSIVANFRNMTGRRVLRGGSWYNTAKNVRVTNRHGKNSALTTSYIGFRCVK